MNGDAAENLHKPLIFIIKYSMPVHNSRDQQGNVKCLKNVPKEAVS